MLCYLCYLLFTVPWFKPKPEISGQKTPGGHFPDIQPQTLTSTISGPPSGFPVRLRPSLRRPLYRFVHSSLSKMVLFETKHPQVKMRRLTISNLRREKWYSTIFRRRTTHLESVGGCRSNGKSRLLTVTNGCFRDSTPATPHRSPLLPLLPWCRPSENRSFLSTIPGSLQVIPGEYHQFQPAIFSRIVPQPNQPTLSTIISNSDQLSVNIAKNHLGSLEPFCCDLLRNVTECYEKISAQDHFADERSAGLSPSQSRNPRAL